MAEGAPDRQLADVIAAIAQLDVISPEDLRRRFPAWTLRTSAAVPIEEIRRHTHIPLPLKVGLHSRRLQIRRFELLRQPTDVSG
jgi:hypothetical protein